MTRERCIMDGKYRQIITEQHKAVKAIYEGKTALSQDAAQALIDHVLYQEYRGREFYRLAETVASLNEMARTLKARWERQEASPEL